MFMPHGQFTNGKRASQILGISQSSLRNFAAQGPIRSIRTPGGQRRYDVGGYIDGQCPSGNETIKKRIVYCRVSTRGQQQHLEHQIAYMREHFPDHEVVRDIGSGLNWKRPGLKRILELAMRGAVEEVVVAHRDRIARFGFQLVDWILQRCGARLVVLNTTAGSEQEELVNDLISLIHVFSAKSYGSRSYKRRRNRRRKRKRRR